MKILTSIAFFFCLLNLYAQPNCEVFKAEGNEIKYKACKKSLEKKGYYQFSRKYQEIQDEAIAIDSTFAFAYKCKSTAYLKSGDFITWKELMDKAVEYDPITYLYYRGWCRYQFFKDYEGAIRDIELLDSLVDYDIGYSENGFYHLQIARAFCYKATGNPQKAIQIIEKQLQEEKYVPGIFDYLHLGVLYFEEGELDQAMDALKRQEKENDISENRYYIALVYKSLGLDKECLENLELAKKKYEAEIRMFDPYSEQMDKIYLIDIQKELEAAKFQH